MSERRDLRTWRYLDAMEAVLDAIERAAAEEGLTDLLSRPLREVRLYQVAMVTNVETLAEP